MRALCGAWAYGGKPIERLLGRRERASIVAAAGGRSGGVEEIAAGPLWLAAAPGNIARSTDAVMGMEGVIAPVAGSFSALPGLLQRFEREPEFQPNLNGHFVLAFADLGRKRLSLLRDLSGVEQVYFAQVGRLVLFSSSVAPLLAHPAVARAADPDTILENGIFGITLFGDATAFEGIREVLPGHRLDVSEDGISHGWRGDLSFEPIAGQPAELGERLWRGLLEGARSALGAQREAAVSLSGGIDSSAVATALAEVLGPEHVHAFTYELEGAPSEAPLARLTCRRLGIVRHTVKTITFAEHLAAVPEALRHLERVANWRMASIELLTARAIAAHGFASYFGGCGIGGHLGYLQEIGEAWSAAPALMRRYWRRTMQNRRSRWRALSSLHPCLDMTLFMRPSLFIPILCTLRRNGLIDDFSNVCPGPLSILAEELCVRPRVRAALDLMRSRSLAAQLQFHAYTHLNSYDDRGRRDKISRLAGARKISPFHFPACRALANLPLKARPPFWDAHRRHRPGKLILREAVRARLPAEVAFRAKTLDNVPSRSWDERCVRLWEPELDAAMQSLRRAYGRSWDAMRSACGQQLVPQALWHSLCIERSSD